jgi:hypothetical protein
MGIKAWGLRTLDALIPRTGRFIREDGEVVNVVGGLGFNVNPLAAGNIRLAADAHTRIHRGEMFSIDTTTPGFDVSVANGASLGVVIMAATGSYPHLTFTVKLGGKGRFLVYELASEAVVSGGTELSASNKKWDSSKVFGGTALRNPTVNLTGATFKEGCSILGVTGPGQTRTGGVASFDQELIITPGRPFYLQVLNESGGAVDACICIDAYNAAQIAED